MIALPADLLAEIDAHDASHNDAAGARAALERALGYQMRAVADGLLADILLHGKPVSSASWWQQLLSHRDDAKSISPRFNGDSLRAYRQMFAQRIATGAIRPMRVGACEDTPIRVYGGKCRFGDEGRINRQLATLGSSMRLLVVGSARQRSQRAQALLLPTVESSGSNLRPDCRFLFGSVGPVTVHLGAALFVFERECALSPYMEPYVSGFVDDARIAVRQSVLEPSEGGAPSDAERLLLSVLLHESIHIAQLGASISASTNGAAWWDTIREDILRLTQSPRTIGEVYDAFDLYVGEVNIKGRQIRRAPEGFSLEGLLNSLVADRLLFMNDDRYFSKIYGSGQSWNL